MSLRDRIIFEPVTSLLSGIEDDDLTGSENNKVPTSAANGAAETGPVSGQLGVIGAHLSIMAAVKLSRPEELPEGFRYRDEFLREDEESELLRIFGGLEFAAYDYHGYQAKRRIVRYGVNYDINTREANESAPPIPEFLLGIRQRAAEFAGVDADDLVHAMVSEYSVGTPIGWHRDVPQFGVIIGISLGSGCRMRLKRYQPPRSLASHRWTTEGGRPHTGLVSLQLERRSIYVMRGAARSEWQHSIPAVEQLRYSITFRTLRAATRTRAA